MEPLLRATVSIGILVFTGKMLAGLMRSLRLPSILGDLLAGIVLSPYALGGGVVIFGEPLVVVNEYVRAFAEIGVIMLLFAAGIEMGLTSLRRTGTFAALVALSGGLIPYAASFAIYRLMGEATESALIASTVFMATGVAITLETLREVGLIGSEVGEVLINSAVMNDILVLSALGVTLGAVESGVRLSLSYVVVRGALFVGAWLLVLAAATFLIPPIVDQAARLGARGAAETVAVSLCFITAAGAGAVGLSPLLGAYSAGLAVGEARSEEDVGEFVESLRLLFGSLFFTYVGTLVDPRLFLESSVVSATLLLSTVALVVKTLASAAPAALRFPVRQALSIGMGMVPMGDLGLVVASMAMQTGALGLREYAELVGVAAVTTFLAPALFTRMCAYARAEPGPRTWRSDGSRGGPAG